MKLKRVLTCSDSGKSLERQFIGRQEQCLSTLWYSTEFHDCATPTPVAERRGKKSGRFCRGCSFLKLAGRMLSKRKKTKKQYSSRIRGGQSRVGSRLGALLELACGNRIAIKKLRTVASTRAAAAAALARLVAIPAVDRAVATRLKRHCCRLAATRTNHRSSLCRARTVAGAPRIVLLCLTAVLATFWGRITTFLKERLIGSGEGELLPAIAASKLNISGHVSPRGNCTAQSAFYAQGFF